MHRQSSIFLRIRQVAFGRRPAVPLSLIILAVLVGCDSRQPSETSSAEVSPAKRSGTDIGDGGGEPAHEPEHLVSFCSACHAMPLPESFPRSSWYQEVRRGFQFYYDSGRTDLKIPVQSEVVTWFQQRAPEKLPEPRIDLHPHALTFSPVSPQLEEVPDAGMVRAISFLGLDRPESDSAGASTGVLVSDMHQGVVRRIAIDATLTAGVTNVWDQAAANPAAVCRCDLNMNCTDDLVIADLGSLMPADHDRGQVVWIPDAFGPAAQPAVNLLPGAGRVADVRPADLDGDQDPDLVVAEFGWHTTGGIHVIMNESAGDTASRFRSKRLDSRPGTIQTPIVDLNGDGRPDFLALISQEHEVIEAFLNRTDHFERVRLFAAPDPSYGSSGLEPADLDGDGDLDIVYTNGDTFDSTLMKPYHGVWCLENTGDLKFVSHRVGHLPGVHRALPADFDGDGDSDLAAVALLPAATIAGSAADRGPRTLQSVVWLEQTGRWEFQMHSISAGIPNHAALLIQDWNSDGRPDLMVGDFNEKPMPGSGLTFLLNGPGATTER